MKIIFSGLGLGLSIYIKKEIVLKNNKKFTLIVNLKNLNKQFIFFFLILLVYPVNFWGFFSSCTKNETPKNSITICSISVGSFHYQVNLNCQFFSDSVSLSLFPKSWLCLSFWFFSLLFLIFHLKINIYFFDKNIDQLLDMKPFFYCFKTTPN